MYQNAAQKTFSSAPFSPTSDSFINLNMSSHRGNIKDIVVVCMSAFLIRESIEPIQFLGFSLQVLCVFAWTFYKQYGQLLPKDIRFHHILASFRKIVHHKSLEKGHAGFENNPEIHIDSQGCPWLIPTYLLCRYLFHLRECSYIQLFYFLPSPS